ncbi:hypothetical protein SAMN02910291_00477 [Desulfovibrio desulfuricans]|uniref:Uncharacterized protein n=1 Tax=Desulfovibrio desulfuricans TaxID=876 RepID=A0AA94L1A4_DESDE|nr:hypothetical protein CNY67_06900 [Desulfovibrio sp. G11]SFW23050.1 hypothetical protein SAMN02910291_00477 [Desulfovibrio desulfuricans]SPD36758.1 Hypothetical protein DSVG11_2724 [Desulfovibrio sp. G11]
MTVEIWDVLQVLTPAAVALVGWGVRLIWSEIKSQRAELREYVRQETCKAHRADLQRQIADLRKDV